MSNKPAIVFVPGGWHKPTCYDKVIDILRADHNFTCVSVTLPSTIGDPQATFEDDIRATQDAIKRQVDQNKDVVIIAHSYGGMVGNSAIKGFARPRDSVDADDGHSRGHVIGLILIASGFTITGFAFMDPFFGIPPPFFKKNTITGFAELTTSPREFFYHDLPIDEGNYWVGELTPHSLKSLFEGGEFAYAGWQDVPSWYIGTLEDKAMPWWAQRLTVGMAQGQGGEVTHRELSTSHSPFLSRPGEVAQIMVEAVEDFQMEPAKKMYRQASESMRAPWWPSRWWSFGFWNGSGRAIGGAILFTRWFRNLFRSG